jgi:hypothetical protein
MFEYIIDPSISASACQVIDLPCLWNPLGGELAFTVQKHVRSTRFLGSIFLRFVYLFFTFLDLDGSGSVKFMYKLVTRYNRVTDLGYKTFVGEISNEGQVSKQGLDYGCHLGTIRPSFTAHLMKQKLHRCLFIGLRWFVISKPFVVFSKGLRIDVINYVSSWHKGQALSKTITPKVVPVLKSSFCFLIQREEHTNPEIRNLTCLRLIFVFFRRVCRIDGYP